MHGYKNVSPHNHPGVRSKNTRKQREHFFSSRQPSADRADRNKIVTDWKPESLRLSTDKKKQIERQRVPEYEIRQYSE